MGIKIHEEPGLKPTVNLTITAIYKQYIADDLRLDPVVPEVAQHWSCCQCAVRHASVSPVGQAFWGRGENKRMGKEQGSREMWCCHILNVQLVWKTWHVSPWFWTCSIVGADLKRRIGAAGCYTTSLAPRRPGTDSQSHGMQQLPFWHWWSHGFWET